MTEPRYIMDTTVAVDGGYLIHHSGMASGEADR